MNTTTSSRPLVKSVLSSRSFQRVYAYLGQLTPRKQMSVAAMLNAVTGFILPELERYDSFNKMLDASRQGLINIACSYDTIGHSYLRRDAAQLQSWGSHAVPHYTYKIPERYLDFFAECGFVTVVAGSGKQSGGYDNPHFLFGIDIVALAGLGIVLTEYLKEAGYRPFEERFEALRTEELAYCFPSHNFGNLAQLCQIVFGEPYLRTGTEKGVEVEPPTESPDLYLAKLDPKPNTARAFAQWLQRRGLQVRTFADECGMKVVSTFSIPSRTYRCVWQC